MTELLDVIADFNKFKFEDGIYQNKEIYDMPDLRIGTNLLDIHALIKDRMFYEEKIISDVDFFARKYSVMFTDLHQRLLRPYLDKALVADVGCGQLPYINAFQKDNLRAFYGVDLSLESLTLARKNYNCSFPLYLFYAPAHVTPISSSSMDCVISSEVIEHVDDPNEYLQELRRVLKKGGMLSLSTPCASLYLYPHSLVSVIKSLLKCNSLPLKNLYKYLTPEKNWTEALSWHPGLRPSVLKKWMRENGFQVVKHKTCLPYYGSPYRFSWDLFKKMENLNFSSSHKIFAMYVRMVDKALMLNIPLLKWGGTRQFILCKKM